MHVHFIAIGGAAMHNLAMELAARKHYTVTGSDDEIFDPALSHLREAGLLPEQTGWHPENITTDIDAVILGMHAREDNPELVRARELNIPIYSFPQYLYEQTKDKTRIVVAGSHGKTTTTAMILYVLRQLGIETDYMVGAQITGFERMVRLSDTAKYAVFEGDEYLTSPLDRRSKFLWYHPHTAILTGIAWDHINVFPTWDLYVDTFRQFTRTINDTLIYFEQDPVLAQLAAESQNIRCIPYNAYNGDVPMQVFGKHNMQNLQAACLACQQTGITPEVFYDKISTFTGADNRLEKIAETSSFAAYKDFAHSPSKLRATINAVRERYPDRQLIACMELHTFSSLTADFLPQYKDSMREADVPIVYYNQHVIEHKHLAPISPDDVKSAFCQPNLQVFTDSQLLKDHLLSQNYRNSVLLLMSSGTFDGINVTDLTKHIIQNNN
ncbi:MAG: peptidoglycan synthetase [Paludibacteraceae bacterium]|nr:peptidoglycan synthetase [Paludibacteraceae bacterium]